MLLSRKKDDILPFVATWVDLAGIILSETSHTEIDTSPRISSMCRSQKQTEKPTKKPPPKTKLIESGC